MTPWGRDAVGVGATHFTIQLLAEFRAGAPQGDVLKKLWKPLRGTFGVRLDFRTFAQSVNIYILPPRSNLGVRLEVVKLALEK